MNPAVRRRLRVRTIVFALIASSAACARQREPGEERLYRAREGQGDVTIAAAWPWELRKEMRYHEGLQMAVDEVNAQGGIRGRRLRVQKYDDRESVNDGRVIAQEIADNPDVVAVVGHLQSFITMETAAVYERAGLVLLAPTSTDPELTERGYQYVFRTCPTDRSIGEQLAEFAASRGLRRFAIYYIRSKSGLAVANSFEARANEVGLTVHARSSYDPGGQVTERTFDKVLGEWKLLALDGILLAGEVPSGAVFVAEARKRGIKVPILGGDAMGAPGLIRIAGAAAEGMIVASYFRLDEPRAEAAAFRTAFTKRYGVAADAAAALGYDSIRLLTHAMQSAATPAPADVALALRGVKGWQGVTGAFTFNDRGDAVGKRVILSIVRDGRFAHLADPAAAMPAAPSDASGSRR